MRRRVIIISTAILAAAYAAIIVFSIGIAMTDPDYSLKQIWVPVYGLLYALVPSSIGLILLCIGISLPPKKEEK
jgi:hypothetical protein